MGKRLLVLFAVIAMLGVVMMTPAAADASRTTFTDFICDDVVTEPTEATTVGFRSRAFHVEEPAIVGSSHAFHLLNPVTGEIIITFGDDPGNGLDKNTTWCTMWGISPEGFPVYLGAEILFPGHG